MALLVRPRYSALERWNEGSGVKVHVQLIQRLRLGLSEGHTARNIICTS
jgi:hypothetical protein